ncbi:hypothetical protein AUL39_10570 [Tractidigestivibacter scatoligenes]|uniref:Uncharacterized protein n=1 Tax=Tractidigestivibacter scatoligenes TaxID=1299998 RepID=A0A100YU45_TRASO|nr:hypothetical protein AUL39_10570 [Tractidigestivibacter scatoligenes]
MTRDSKERGTLFKAGSNLTWIYARHACNVVKRPTTKEKHGESRRYLFIEKAGTQGCTNEVLKRFEIRTTRNKRIDMRGAVITKQCTNKRGNATSKRTYIIERITWPKLKDVANEKVTGGKANCTREPFCE